MRVSERERDVWELMWANPTEIGRGPICRMSQARPGKAAYDKK